jgi:MFS family permease
MQAARTRTRTGDRLFRLLIGALILASAAAQFALVPVMPVYARRLGLSGFEQGMVLGATGLASLAVSVPAGTLSDRLGCTRPGRPPGRSAWTSPPPGSCSRRAAR